MTDGPRLAPRDPSDYDERTAEMMAGLDDLNIFRTLAHHPDLLRRWLVFGSHVLMKSTLPARERELLILRVGWRCGAVYEFGQHTEIGRAAGVTDDEIRRLATDAIRDWSPRDAALLRAADELVTDHNLSDESWDALREDWSTEQLLDLVFTVGQYTLVSMALNTLGVELDEGVPGWPS